MKHDALALRGVGRWGSILLLGVVGCGGGGGGGGSGGGSGGGGGDGGEGGAIVIEKPNRYRMRLDDAAVPSVVLELDKEKALKVFGEDGAKQVIILNVDTTALLRNAVGQIQSACGEGWRNDTANPNHNCALTPLGQSFGAGWRTSAEFALIRLLTMTPANANVTGTSLEDFKHLIDDNPSTFAFTFADVLAESLGISRTSPFVPTEQLIQALQQQLLATHPAIDDPTGVRMPVSLYDALLDLGPLSQRFGAIGSAPWSNPGEHPGVLVADDATFTTHSNVLLPEFSMRVVANSSLRWVSGVDLSKGGGSMFLRNGDAPLEFDFNDPQKLIVQGIAPNPTVDMRFAMREISGVVPSCTDVPACKSNLPDTPVGTGTVWTARPFFLEPIVAKAAFLTYGDRSFTRCFINFGGVCRVGVDIGQRGDPLGWTVFNSNISFPPDPPPQAPAPQFIWELLDEIAQVSVHDPSGDGTPDITPDGNAQPVYTLRDVGIGLTGEQIIADLRPTLQAQSKKIAEIILGRYWVNNDALDIFYSRADNGDPYLFFVAEEDLRPSDQGTDSPRPYGYKKPGFFTKPDLSEGSRVSLKTVNGVSDTVHEKYKLSTGTTTLYMQDDEDAVYEVEIYVPKSGEALEITADVKRL